MTQRDPVLALQHMRDHAAEAVGLAARRKRRDLDTDRVLLLALTKLVEIVGEAANRVPAEYQARHPTIAWADIVSFRNRLTHGYDDVDRDVLWASLGEDLPDLVKRLDKILKA